MITEDLPMEEQGHLKFYTSLDAEPRMPLSCIIVHRQNVVAGVGNGAGIIFVWSIEKLNSMMRARPIRILQDHKSQITALLDLGEYFVSCSKDGELRVWKDFIAIFSLTKTHGIDRYPTSLASFWPHDAESPIVFSGGTDGLLIAYDLKAGRACNVATGHTGWILTLHCKNESPFLLSGCTNGSIRLWNAETLQFLHEFQGHKDKIYCLYTFENILAAGDRAGEIRMFDLYTGDCLKTVDHGSDVYSIHMYKRDGQLRILSMGNGNYISEWNMISLENTMISKLHFGGIRASLLYKDWLFTAARDGAVGIWTLKRDVLNEKAPVIQDSPEMYNSILAKSLRNEWLGIQKIIKDSKQSNLKLQNDINSLQNELMMLKLCRSADVIHRADQIWKSEFNHISAYMNEILDQQLKISSHQIIQSAVLLKEIHSLFPDDFESLRESLNIFHDINGNEDLNAKELSTLNRSNSDGEHNPEKLKRHNSTEKIFDGDISNPAFDSDILVVLSASSCSESDQSCHSSLSDNFSLDSDYFGDEVLPVSDKLENGSSPDLSGFPPIIDISDDFNAIDDFSFVSDDFSQPIPPIGSCSESQKIGSFRGMDSGISL